MASLEENAGAFKAKHVMESASHPTRQDRHRYLFDIADEDLDDITQLYQVMPQPV